MTNSNLQAVTVKPYSNDVKLYLDRRDVKLFNVMCETGINVGRLAEIVNANYPPTDEEKHILAVWASEQPNFS